MKWKNPKENPAKEVNKKVLFIDLQIITSTQSKVKKHLKPEDTVEMYRKHKLN